MGRLVKEVKYFQAFGVIELPFPPGTYTLSWRLRLDNPSGWESHPVHFILSTDDVKVDERKGFISTSAEVSSRRVDEFELPTIRVKENGWLEYDVGEFVVETGRPRPTLLKFAMRSFEGDCKTGISLDGVVVQRSSTTGLPAISECDGLKLMTSMYEMRRDAFYWQWVDGIIYRPRLTEVGKHLEIFLGINSGHSKVLLGYAERGLDSEAQWNWDEAIRCYREFRKYLGGQLQQGQQQQQGQNDVRAHSYLWLDTWATVPDLLWQQFVAAGDQLKECISGWEELRNRWPRGDVAHWSMRQHQALAMLERNHYEEDCPRRKDVEAVNLFLNAYTPDVTQSDQETLTRMSFILFRHHYWAWRFVKAQQWMNITLDFLKFLPKKMQGLRFEVLWGQKQLLISAGKQSEAKDVVCDVTEGLTEPKKKKSPNDSTVENIVLQDLKRKLELEEGNSTPADKDKLERQLNLEKWKLVGEKNQANLLDRIKGVMSIDRIVERHMVLPYSLEVQRGLSAAQQVLMKDNFVDCILQSLVHYVNKKYDDALKCLRLAWDMLEVNGTTRDGLHLNLLRRTVLIHVALCHNGHFEAKFKSAPTSRGEEGSAYIQLVESHLRNVEKVADQAAIDDISSKLLWVDSETPVYNYDAVDHLECAIRCYRNCLILSSGPGSSAIDRLDDLMRLSNELYQKEEIYFEQMCLGKLSVEAFLQAWDEARFALEKYVELSSRLLHASWDRRHVVRGSNDGEAFKMLHELFTKKTYLAQQHPDVIAGKSDFQAAALNFRKLLCSERPRAQTLLLGDSKLTNVARDHFLKFSLDEEFAVASILHSLLACGPGAVFVSLNAVLCWNIYMTALSVDQDGKTMILDFRMQDEDCLLFRGVLEKTVVLLASKWKSQELEEKSKQLEEHLDQLGAILLSPIWELILKMGPEQKLVFCASSYLTHIPFPILRKNGRYLFQDHTISVTPSLRVLHPCSQRYQVLLKRPLVAGNAAGVVLADPDYDDCPGWDNLDGSRVEADSICSLFPDSRVEKLLKKEASLKNLFDRAQLPSQEHSQGFIHVAAHAEVSKENPKGVLILSPGHDDSNSDGDWDSDDGDHNAAMKISAERISDSNFEWCAALVVLSACNSVHGKFYSEGVHNLPRAFMIAGVPCLVVSQWKVNDAVAPKLMESFYTSLRKGMDVASALRLAMCQMLEEKQPLYAFAPFLVWGLPTVCLPKELQLDS